MKSSTILRKARTVIVEKGWTKGQLARNKYRHSVDPTSPSAVKFCAYGAIHHVLNVKSQESDSAGVHLVSNVARYLKDTIPVSDSAWHVSVDRYNDSDETTLEDVKKWFNRAIKLAKEREG